MNTDVIVGVCGCGKSLYPVYSDGKIIGVTHTPEDEDHHLSFWSIDETAERMNNIIEPKKLSPEPPKKK